MKKFLTRYWILIILSVLSLAISYPVLLPGYFPHHDDLQVMRIFEMRRCLEDLQIPCRWVPDMGYGNGFPLFNYYSPLPYYIGALLSFFVGYVESAKLLFFIPMIAGTLGIYLLAKLLFKDERASFLAAVLYTLAPYRAVDTYVRGAVAESFAMAIAPFVFYLSLKLIREPSKKVFAGLVLSITALMLSHNIMTLFFLPMLIIWSILWIVIEKQYKSLKILLISMLLGVGMAVFFVVPAFMEKNLVTTETLTRFDLNFRVHFVTIPQLFIDRDFEYGASTYGPDDNLSFQVGWPHWWLVVIGILVMAYGIWKRRPGKELWVYGFLALSFLGSIFMTHNRSAFVWEQVPILQYVQFPWRFLSVTILAGSLLAVIWLEHLKGKVGNIILGVVIAMALVFNFQYFKPAGNLPDINDSNKLTGVMWEEQQKAAVLDYLPKTAAQPLEAAPLEPVGNSEFRIQNFENASNKWLLDVEVLELTQIEVPVFDFPNWKVYVDGGEITHNNDNHLGRISFNLEPGEYKVVGRFKDTPVRSYSNVISLISLAGFIGALILWKRLRIF